jgi:hypothetical protein
MTGAPKDGRAPGPRAALMQEVAEEMDGIEAEFGEDFEIGRVITVIEVKTGGDHVELRVRAGQFPWVALGMLQVAQKIVETRLAGGGN